MDIKGHTVHRVLVTEASDIAEEYYFSFLLDRANRTSWRCASAEGGMEIEQLAVERPGRAGHGSRSTPIAGRGRGQGRARSSPPGGFPADGRATRPPT